MRRTVGAALLALAVAAPATADTTSSPGPEPTELGGTPVVGGSAGQPTQLVAGLWSDTLVGPGEDPANTRWFSYTRAMAQSRVFVGVVASAVDPVNDQIRVEVRSSDGEACGSYDDSTASSAPGVLMGALKVVGLENDDPACLSSPELRIAVSRGSTSGLASSMPFALRVVEEPPLPSDDDSEPPADHFLQTLATDEAAPTAGARSFDDAPSVDGTVRDQVPQGTERLWKVHLDWGQALAWRLQVPSRPESETSTPDPQVEVTLFDPMRNAFDGGAVDAETSGSYGFDGADLSDTTAPIADAQLSGDAALVPGDYWVAVSVATSPTDDAPIEVPIELTVGATGEKTGAPDFPDAVTGPGGRVGPAGYDKSTPFLVGDGVFSADVSGTPTSPDDEAAADPDVRRIAGFAVGAASLVSLLAGVVLLRRRARFSRAAAR
ncbi:hypothetical protein [Nocardioides plantarum]